MPSEPPTPPLARIRHDGPLVELVDERGEAILSVVLGRASRADERRVIARLIREGRARGYQVENPEGFLG